MSTGMSSYYKEIADKIHDYASELESLAFYSTESSLKDLKEDELIPESIYSKEEAFDHITYKLVSYILSKSKIAFEEDI